MHAIQSTKTSLQRMVRPRDAASLVLIRQEGGEPEVLLGRRSSTMAFMPNAYVFPGGAVEPDDRQVWPASQLHLNIIPHLAKTAL